MATEILRPSAAGDETNITYQSPSSGEHWDKVDEVVQDGQATMVYHTTNDWVRDLYNVGASAIGTGTINSIVVSTYCAVAGSTERTNLKIIIKSGTGAGEPTTVTEGSEQTLPIDTPTLLTQTWTTNPVTSSAWTWNEIDKLQIGISLRPGTSADPINTYAWCTQVYVVIRIDNAISASVTLGLAPSASRATTISRSSSVALGLSGTTEIENNKGPALCIASQSGGSIKTTSSVGASWSTAAKTAGGTMDASWFAQYDNRLCVLNYQNSGFSYSSVNDIDANWTNKPNFPNLPVLFTGMFAGKDASDNSILYFLTQKGMYYLDVFTNFIFNPTEVTWEEDNTSGKKGLYWKGDNYIAVGKGIYKLSGAEVTLVGPDMDDGLPEDMQGTVTDMIGVGFWLVIAVDGGGSNKSSILKRYITGKHWHPVYVSAAGSRIKTLFWDSGTLYFGESTNVKSLPFPTITDNVNALSTQTRAASGTLTYPWFHSVFETMPKTAHKVWATTKNCTTDETITIHYRKDEETTWTSLGSFTTSPRPTALTFGTSGVQFERIQLRASYARGATTTNSPKVESLVLEYEVIPPTLWSWTMKVKALTSKDQKGSTLIAALKTAIETGTLLPFYPDGDKSSTVYYVRVKGMPGGEKGTEFGVEGIYSLTVSEVVG